MKLLTYSITGECISQNERNGIFLASWIVRNLMHANLSLILLITLYANWGRLQQCFAEEWINGPLWFIIFKREIPYKVLIWSHGCDLPTNMATTVEQTYKLPNIISTIPTTTASAERSFSALMRIKTYLHSIDSQDTHSQLSLLSTSVA